MLLAPSPRIYEQLWLGCEFTMIRLTRNMDLDLGSRLRAGIVYSATVFNAELVSGVPVCGDEES